jgi:hypothetical protein
MTMTIPDAGKLLEKRLPKQMRHWCEQAGLHARGWQKARNWRRENVIYASGRRAILIAGCRDAERFVRILPHLDRMDICDGDFDRWANSMGASISPIPRTEAAFNEAIKTLLKKARVRARAASSEPAIEGEGR